MSENKIDPNLLGEKIVNELKQVYDPEIPVDVYELGLIYDVFINEDNEVKILMTLIIKTLFLFISKAKFKVITYFLSDFPS